MKIVYFNYLYDMKVSSVGAAVHVKELEKALQGCGHEVKTYYLNRFTSVEASYESRLRRFLKTKLWRYLNQVNGIMANGRYFIREWKIVSQERPNILLIRYNLLNFSAALVARLKKVPFVLEMNAPMAYENRIFADHIFKLPLIPEILEKLNLLLADRVMVVSNALKDFYVKWHIHAQKIFVVPNGVDENKFYPEISSENILSRYGIEQKIIIGFVGSFHYWHGVENLKQFINTTLSQFSNVAFFLVGEGPLKKNLEEQLRSGEHGNRVIFPGYVSYEEIPKYVATMDVVLALYPKLDFFYFSPLKLFEYLAAGKAVIASKIGQIEEIIQDGVNGILFEPDNLDELKQKLSLLIEQKELRRQMGCAGRKTIIERFTWYHTAKRISDEMKTIQKKKK